MPGVLSRFSRKQDAAAPERPIEDHGVIGDLRTMALVARDGCIDFLCAPQFDSPSIFAQLLDPGAGHFTLTPRGDSLRTSQLYLPGTNVLLTRFMSEDGIAELSDHMPVSDTEARQRIVRRVKVVRGRFAFAMTCAPRFGYGTEPHSTDVRGNGGAFRPRKDKPALTLRATVPLSRQDHDITAQFELQRGEDASFELEIGGGDPTAPLSPDAVSGSFETTVAWWHRWLDRATYRGRWREVVERSALALKLMTSREHGAIVAAPTFGLPEQAGGERNWDYRYCWIRDASFTMYAFMRLGFVAEAEHFIDWISARVRGCDDEDAPLRIMYALDGATELPETSLEHFAGYAGSRPVRVGNGAFDQFQLDIYGELMDAVYLANKYGRAISYDGWRNTSRVVDWVCQNWRRPDRGIWEGRGDEKTFLHSRLMCWVTIDRAIRLATKRSLPAPLPHWNEVRVEIHGSIHDEFWDGDAGTFTEYPGAKVPDGSILLMPLVRFISPVDPRWLGTMRAVEANLVEDALVFRRAPDNRALDGLHGDEGSFLACSFWYVECLARMRDLAKARLVFEKLLGYANHLGLYSEELSPTGRLLGNFPQALTHLALISAAVYLDRTLSHERPDTWS